MSNLYKSLSLIIFIVVIWSINSFLLPRVSSDLEFLSKSKRDLSVKKSFDDNSPANLSKSMNEFALKQFDKNQVINLIDSFSKESGVIISNLDIQATDPETTDISLDDEVLDETIVTTSDNTIQSNTLRSVDLNLNIKGSKNSIDLFISKLVESNQYIDIQNININSDSGRDTATTLQSTIIAKIYYVKL